MKRVIVSLLAIASGAVVLMGQGRGMGGEGSAPRTRIYRRSRVAVAKPSMPSHAISGQSRASYPERDESGARISMPASRVPPAQHANVVGNAGLVHNIQTQERTEVTPNHYYWHNDGGMRYAHYYDGHDHWYGFYHGPTFYWSRYYADRWWWFDVGVARWVFWWNGFWWWPGPGGAAFVYVSGNYYPYEDAGVAVEQEETQAPPAAIPTLNPGSASKSPDGRRMVQITGAQSEAFLYDNTVTPPSFVKFLGGNVSTVRYSGGAGGAPLQILVEYKDNTFALFDADGNSQSAALKAAEPQAPPLAKPDQIPPPPGSAPGQ